MVLVLRRAFPVRLASPISRSAVRAVNRRMLNSMEPCKAIRPSDWCSLQLSTEKGQSATDTFAAD